MLGEIWLRRFLIRCGIPALRQQITAHGAFGAPDLQQGQRDFILHFDGVDDHALSSRALLTNRTDTTLIASSTTKSRREQQDLANGTCGAWTASVA